MRPRKTISEFIPVFSGPALVVALAVLFLFGCQSTPTSGPAVPNDQNTQKSAKDDDAATGRRKMEVNVSGAEATTDSNQNITLDYPVLRDKNDMIPDWVINPNKDGVLGAVGVGPKCQLGTKEQLDEARLNARLELAQMLELRLQGVDRGQLEQQIQAEGESISDRSRKSILGVDRSLTDIVLAGTRQRALWFDPETDECFVWMVLDGKILEKVDHHITKDISVFVANTPVGSVYVPVRRKQQAPTVIVNVADKPKSVSSVEGLEEKLKDIENIPMDEGDKKDENKEE